MALPPGTSGWIGSGFDCGCDCTFEAAWYYNGNLRPSINLDPPPICLLSLVVRGLKSGCTELDFDLADLTIVIRKNGSIVSLPITTYTDSNGGGGYLEIWKPEANDVYTAEVTLDCGYGNTFTRTYSFTVPDPANTNCNCCTERVPDYVTISGLTGIASGMNGTWSLSQVSTCEYHSGPHTGATDPADPCSGGTQLESCTIGLSTFYFYPMGFANPAVTVILPGLTGKIQITFGAAYKVWRYNPTFSPACGNTGFGSCAFFSIAWVFEIDCNTGAATLVTRGEGQGGGSSATLNYVSSIPNPTVSLTMA